jgi:hypothetical protein
MKKLFTILLLALSLATLSQPVGMNYQSVIRSADGLLVQNQPIGVQVSVLKKTAMGITVFQERHFVNTNMNGLCALHIGDGTLISGSIDDIDWGCGDDYYIKTEIDLRGGSTYTQEYTTQVLSVPYAFHSATAGAVDGVDFSVFARQQDLFSGMYSDLTGAPLRLSYFENDLNLPFFSGNYNDLTDRPLYLSYFENDMHYLLEEDLDYFSGLYEDLTGCPTKLSDFDNDLTFIDMDVTNELQDLQLVGGVLSLTKSDVLLDLSDYDQQDAIDQLMDDISDLKDEIIYLKSLIEEE